MTERMRASIERRKRDGTFARSGRMGGLKTRERLQTDPDYYASIGAKGGYSLLDKRGISYFEDIGRRPRKKRKELHD